MNTNPGYVIDSTADLQSDMPLTACDLVSHHLESASLRVGDWDFAITFSQAGSTFAVQTPESNPTLNESARLVELA